MLRIGDSNSTGEQLRESRAKCKVVSARHGVFLRLGCRPRMERRRCGAFLILRMVAAIFV
jgi:hypothetical protein